MGLGHILNSVMDRLIKPIPSLPKLKQMTDLLIAEALELKFRIDQLKQDLEGTMSQTTQLERENLSAHVDLCALRYEQLNSRLTSLEFHVEEIKRDILAGQRSLKGILIKTTGTIVAALLTLTVTLLFKL